MAPKFFSKYALISMALLVCLAAIPAPVHAASLPSESTALKNHVIKFYLDPALVPDKEFAKV
ncbi:MAG: hypothetical protein JNM46_10590, partial [Anaerolineales bacterium]|nr:hypothetical protein [Anaerolineales bacterium]